MVAPPLNSHDQANHKWFICSCFTRNCFYTHNHQHHLFTALKCATHATYSHDGTHLERRQRMSHTQHLRLFLFNYLFIKLDLSLNLKIYCKKIKFMRYEENRKLHATTTNGRRLMECICYHKDIFFIYKMLLSLLSQFSFRKFSVRHFPLAFWEHKFMLKRNYRKLCYQHFCAFQWNWIRLLPIDFPPPFIK